MKEWVSLHPGDQRDARLDKQGAAEPRCGGIITDRESSEVGIYLEINAFILCILSLR